MLRAIRFLSICLFAATVTIALVSCGGSGQQSRASGSLQMTVRWPSTRDIPPATRSLKVTANTLRKNDAGLIVEDKLVGEKVVVRPEGQASSTVSLDDLPSVDVRVKVLAFESTDASGDAIALGMKDVTVASGQTSSIEITLHADVPFGCQEYKVTLGSQSLTGTTSQRLHEDATSSNALATGSFGGVVTYNATSASATSTDYYKVDAPGMLSFSAKIHYKISALNLTPDFPGNSAYASVRWPGGSKTTSGFETVEMLVPITLHDGDVVKLVGTCGASAGENLGVSSDYSVWIDEFPSGVRFIEANCQ